MWGETSIFNILKPPLYNFNPLSPCGERRKQNERHLKKSKFQPTLPVWGETSPWYGSTAPYHHFNPLSPCGERQMAVENFIILCLFQPTLPVWGETNDVWRTHRKKPISTHSPRVGRDQVLPVTVLLLDISTHSPRVGRDIKRRKQ